MTEHSSPEPVDKHVGKQIRAYRHAKGLTQQGLAEAVGVRFQQIQKYETAANRVSASRLAEICHALGQPITVFFPAEFHPEANEHLSALQAEKDALENRLAAIGKRFTEIEALV
jgi:transcriptional regulator with XRE-family HTH domain